MSVCLFPGFLSLGEHLPKATRGKLEDFLAAQHPAEKVADCDFRWSKKPLTCVTLLGVEVKVMQHVHVTTDKMSNNGGTGRKETDVLNQLVFFEFF